LELPFMRDLINPRSPEAAAQLREHRALAIKYIEGELAAANPAALHAMARTYREGVLRAPDAILAYAYAYAATLAPGDHRVLNETLPGHAAGFSPDELALARLRGTQIYDQCCS
jgi:hypothetical protein